MSSEESRDDVEAEADAMRWEAGGGRRANEGQQRTQRAEAGELGDLSASHDKTTGRTVERQQR